MTQHPTSRRRLRDFWARFHRSDLKETARRPAAAVFAFTFPAIPLGNAAALRNALRQADNLSTTLSRYRTGLPVGTRVLPMDGGLPKPPSEYGSKIREGHILLHSIVALRLRSGIFTGGTKVCATIA